MVNETERQSLPGKTRPVLEQPGPTGCKSITPAGKLLFLGPGQTIPGTVESERGHPQPIGRHMSSLLCSVVLPHF